MNDGVQMEHILKSITLFGQGQHKDTTSNRHTQSLSRSVAMAQELLRFEGDAMSPQKGPNSWFLGHVAFNSLHQL